MNKPNDIPRCCVTDEPLDEERIAALTFLEIPRHLWAKADVSPVKRVRAHTEHSYSKLDVKTLVESEDSESE